MSPPQRVASLRPAALEHEACRHGTAELRSFVLHLLSSSKGGTLLDVGAGDGDFCKEAHEKLGMQVLGTELRRSYVTYEGLDIAEVDLDADPLPFPDNMFDYVICIEVVEHLRKPWGCIEEMIRVAKAKGLVIITTPNVEGLLARLKFLFTGIIRSFESPVWRNPLEHLHAFTRLEFLRGFDLLGLGQPSFSYAKPALRALPWGWYMRNFRGRRRLRNLSGWLKWNTLWVCAAAFSLLRYGSPSTQNRLFAESIVVQFRKGDEQYSARNH